MRVPRLTPPPSRPGERAAPATGRRRGPAVLLAAGLLASLFAPWSTQTVTARGLAGPRRIRVSFTGWQALSPAAITCVAIALAVATLLLVRSRTPIEGLGAHGRRAARARIDGGLVAAGGLLAAGVLLAGLLAPPEPAVNLTGAVSSAGVRWGAGLALGLALALAGLGLAIERAGARAGRHRDSATRHDPVTRHGAPAAAGARPAVGVADGEPPIPEFDFAVGDGRRRSGERSVSLSRPRRRSA